ncbi:hypothetical protein RG903_05825 [Thermithiobacillus tepidarius DSM 3134]|uniref:hypothetical protein n=1 Tax=Thermithiobacillus tepidarius TaxID=929 RepID=UPI0012DE97B0|nr:hypothetical protein [Thermithiobacillus tepidarius]
MASNVRWLGLATSLLAAGAAAQEPDPRFSIELEGGGVWQSRNKVQIPNDATGTRFDLAELTGSGPYAAGRLTFTYAFRPRHELRLVYAPFSLGSVLNQANQTMEQARWTNDRKEWASLS